MLPNKETDQIFSDKLKQRFLELGLPKSTVHKVSKIIHPLTISGDQIISSCNDQFYLDQVIIPQKEEIDKIIKLCYGDQYKFVLHKSRHENNLNIKLDPATQGPSQNATKKISTSTSTSEEIKK
jgi:hypothetical protein